MAASLRRAEALLARAWDEVPSTLLRVATVVGHSRTGDVDLLDGLYLVVLLMMSAPRDLVAPLPLRDAATLNVVPVDHVARAGVALGASAAAAGGAWCTWWTRRPCRRDARWSCCRRRSRGARRGDWSR